MYENALAGFFNGGRVPFGYESVTVANFGDKAKRKLTIVEAEAEIVRQIFRLARFGKGSGPMGARAVATWLNERGYSLRGARFNNSNTADIFSSLHYLGYYHDGKSDEYGDPFPESSWVRVPCPAIIDESEFLEVAALRALRSPKATPPRVTTVSQCFPRLSRNAEALAAERV